MDSPPGRSDPAPAGWLIGAEGVAYPPAPWYLRATMLIGVLAVPASGLPGDLRDAVPDGVTPVVLGGRAVVGLAFVRYRPDGVLAYSELLVAVLGRGRPGALRCSIGQIWVDSAASRSGGRELWAIPKELGAFEWTAGDGAVHCRLAGVADVAARPGRALTPTAVPVPLVVAQHRGDGVPVLTGSRLLARPRAVRADWTFAPDGPLGYLVGRRPIAGIALRDASLTFGDAGGDKAGPDR